MSRFTMCLLLVCLVLTACATSATPAPDVVARAISLTLTAQPASPTQPPPTQQPSPEVEEPIVRPEPPTPTPVPPAPAATEGPPTDTPAPPTSTPVPPTDTPVPPTNTPVPPTVNSSANVRLGPGTEYDVLGQVSAGDVLSIVAQSPDGEWLQTALTGGVVGWIASFLVDGVPDSLPVSEEIPPTPLPPTATLPPPFRPATGMLQDRAPGGQGELTIKNGTDSDALVILTGLDDQAVKSAYIWNAASFTMTGIPDGTYRLYYSKGEAFDKETNRFALNATYQRLDATLEFTTSGSQYTIWEVTLYGVVGGNVGSESVDPSEFP